MDVKTNKPKPRYTLRKRAADPIEGIPRACCYDLIIEDADGRAVLEDAASSRARAIRLLELFRENTVGSIEAPYIMEDLLADGEFIE